MNIRGRTLPAVGVCIWNLWCYLSQIIMLSAQFSIQAYLQAVVAEDVLDGGHARSCLKCHFWVLGLILPYSFEIADTLVMLGETIILLCCQTWNFSRYLPAPHLFRFPIWLGNLRLRLLLGRRLLVLIPCVEWTRTAIWKWTMWICSKSRTRSLCEFRAILKLIYGFSLLIYLHLQGQNLLVLLR